MDQRDRNREDIKMVQNSHNVCDLEQTLVTIRALSSLTSSDVDMLSCAVNRLTTGWMVQTCDDYDGYLSILIEPTVHDDKQKAFFISGTAQHLELFEVHDDNLIPVADFSDVEGLSVQLLDLIARQ